MKWLSAVNTSRTILKRHTCYGRRSSGCEILIAIFTSLNTLKCSAHLMISRQEFSLLKSMTHFLLVPLT